MFTYGSTEHRRALRDMLPGGPGFTALVIRFGDEDEAAWWAQGALRAALGREMPPDVSKAWFSHPDDLQEAFPVSAN